ncbi:UNVERIFIED_CONTAM: hypothetical protein FKN15_071800 [Acipenser sinensis]
MQRFITDDVMKRVKTLAKLFTEDLTVHENHKDASMVNTGFVADKLLKELKLKKKVSGKDVLTVKTEAKKCLLTTVTKLLEKCPLRYTLVRNLGWLDPKQITENPGQCEKQLKTCLQIMSNNGQMRKSKCDQIITQFKDFATFCRTSDDFSQFNETDSRLDCFFYEQLSKDHRYQELWEVTQKLLLLSHGQASVERGYSINKQIIVENMKERTLVAQKVIVDHLHYVGGVTHMRISKELLQSAGSARQRYHAYLDEEGRKKEDMQKSQKRKAALDEVEELKVKKRKIETNIKTLLASADKLAVEAEATDKISFLSQLNALRKAAKEKEHELEEYDQKTEQKMNVM